MSLKRSHGDGLLILRNLDVDESGSLEKKGALLLYGYYVHNANASTLYVKIYDKATAPTVGTDTPVLTLPVPSGASGHVHIGGDRGIKFDDGIGVGATTGVGDSDTGAPSTNDVVLNLFYK